MRKLIEAWCVRSDWIDEVRWLFDIIFGMVFRSSWYVDCVLVAPHDRRNSRKSKKKLIKLSWACLVMRLSLLLHIITFPKSQRRRRRANSIFMISCRTLVQCDMTFVAAAALFSLFVGLSIWSFITYIAMIRSAFFSTKDKPEMFTHNSEKFLSFLMSLLLRCFGYLLVSSLCFLLCGWRENLKFCAHSSREVKQSENEDTSTVERRDEKKKKMTKAAKISFFPSHSLLHRRSGLIHASCVGYKPSICSSEMCRFWERERQNQIHKWVRTLMMSGGSITIECAKLCCGPVSTISSIGTILPRTLVSYSQK